MRSSESHEQAKDSTHQDIALWVLGLTELGSSSTHPYTDRWTADPPWPVMVVVWLVHPYTDRWTADPPWPVMWSMPHIPCALQHTILRARREQEPSKG